MHGLFVKALLEVLGAVFEDFLRLILMLHDSSTLFHANVIRVDHLVEACFTFESVSHAQWVDLLGS